MKRTWTTLAVVLVAALLVLGGAWMMVDSTRLDHGDAPLPPNAAADLTQPQDEENAGSSAPLPPPTSEPLPAAPPAPEQAKMSVQYDTSGDGPGVPKVVTPESLGPNRLYVPNANPLKVINAPVTLGGIKGGELAVPSNPHHLTMYDNGGSACGSEGTVLLAGHVSYSGRKGALHYLAQVPAGTVVYMTCADGTLTRWITSAPKAAPKHSLDQGVFTAKGPHRMTLITCGGVLRRNGTFADNVRVDLTPLN